MEICMSKKEKELFEKYINISNNYYEYGSGGSTYLVCCKENINKIYAVESNTQWIDTILSHKVCYNRKENNKLIIKFYQINKNPKQNILANHLKLDENQVFKLQWEKYSQSISELTQKELDSIDFVLVDGRFRVACCLMAINYVNNDCKIAIHDYYFSGKSCNRYKTYCVVEKYLDKIEETEQLVIFKKKQNINLDELLKDYNLFKHNTL
jgi:hypothetical protein